MRARLNWVLHEDLVSKINLSLPVASAADRPNAMVLLLFLHCSLLHPLVARILCKPLFCFAVLCVLFNFAILIALLLLSSECYVVIIVL